MSILMAAGRTSLVTLYILSLGLAACGGSPAPSKPSPILHGHISVAGQQRGYRLFRPPSLGSRPAPLVILLHGCFPGATGDQVATAFHFDDQATSVGFVAVYPDGIGGCWNQGPCCTTADDVGFIGALLDRLVKEGSIDRSRILVAGWSGGGAMAYRLACELPSRLTAVASVAGAWWLDLPCRPARPVSILEMHGTDDSRSPFDGGGPLNLSPVLAVSQRWAQLDGCSSSPTLTQSGITKSSTWGSCQAGTVVRLDITAGGRHSWFGCHVPPCDPVPGEPDANSVVWSFFNGLRPASN